MRLLLFSHDLLSSHDHDALVAVADWHTRKVIGLLRFRAALSGFNLMDARRRRALFVEPDRNAVETRCRDAGGRTILVPVDILLDGNTTIIPAVERQRDERLTVLCECPRAVVLTVARTRHRAVATERHRHRFLLVGLAERGICLVVVGTGLLIRMLEQMIGASDLLSRKESFALDLFLCSVFR